MVIVQWAYFVNETCFVSTIPHSGSNNMGQQAAMLFSTLTNPHKTNSKYQSLKTPEVFYDCVFLLISTIKPLHLESENC